MLRYPTQMFSGGIPFKEITHEMGVMIALFKDQRPARPQTPLLSDLMWQLIEICWQKDPSRRPTALHVLRTLTSMCERRPHHREQVMSAKTMPIDSWGHNQRTSSSIDSGRSNSLLSRLSAPSTHATTAESASHPPFFPEGFHERAWNEPPNVDMDINSEPEIESMLSPPITSTPLFPWSLGERIASGQYGCVYRGTNTETGQTIAVKQILLTSAKGSPDTDDANRRHVSMEMLKQESEILRSLHHPNIVEYLGFEQDNEYWNMRVFRSNTDHTC